MHIEKHYNSNVIPFHDRLVTRLPRLLRRQAHPQQPAFCRRIAIVDDSPTHLVHLKALLSQIPHVTIDTFDRGTLDVLDAIEFHTNLVIIDYLMPEMSGIEFLRLLKARSTLGAVPTLMLTAVHNEATRMSALQAGVTNFRTKPINPSDLLRLVEKMLPSA